MIRIYFAGPLFCQAEKEFNLKLCSLLEKKGYSVFLPQRDGLDASKMINKTEKEKSKMIFDKDTSEIKNADVFFMILDGRVPDEGACVELGIAYTLNKRCFGFKTDVRSMEKDLEINPLIYGCFNKIFFDENNKTALENLTLYLENNKL